MQRGRLGAQSCRSRFERVGRVHSWRTSIPRQSKAHSDLASEDQRVVAVAGPAGLDDVLEVRLDEERAFLEVEAVGQLDRRLVVLHAGPRGGLLCLPLCVLEVLAKMAEHYPEPARIGRPSV